MNRLFTSSVVVLCSFQHACHVQMVRETWQRLDIHYVVPEKKLLNVLSIEHHRFAGR